MSLTVQEIFNIRTSKSSESMSELQQEGTLSHTKKIASSAENDTSFCQSIKLSSRSTFHRSHSEKSSGLPDSKDEQIANGVTRNEKLLEMLTSSFRLPCSIPLDRIAETISIALIDPCNESYGKTGDKFAVNRANAKRGIENLKYSYSDLSFSPDGCTWRGRVNYSCKQLVKSPSESQGMTKICVENAFDFSVQCQTVLTDQYFVDEKKESGDDKFKASQGKHYSIDIQAKFEAHHDRYIDNLKVISQTVNHIEYDVSRALYCLSLPKFPEGCGKEKFRSIYQLNFKVNEQPEIQI